MRWVPRIAVPVLVLALVAAVLAGIGPARTLFAMSRGHTGTRPAPSSRQAAAGTPPPWCVPWTISQTPNPGANSDYLGGLTATAANDVWAAGFAFTGTNGQPLVEHWNGTTWSATIVANTYWSHFSGVAALAPNNIWAVGGQLVDANDTSHTLIAHFDGNGWSIMPSPNVNGVSNYLTAVAAVSTTDIWAVGNTTTLSFQDQPLILHWDGSSWSIVPGADVGSGNSDLFGVAAISGNDVWAVGSDGTTNTPLAEHWNGTSWSIVPAPAYPAHSAYPARPTHLAQSQVSGINAFDGVTARASNDVWAVGEGAGAALAEHWNGTSWSVMSTLKVNAISQLYAITAVPNSAVLWAVGDDGPDPFTSSYPLIEEWTGSQWVVSPAINSTTSNSADVLNGVVAPSAGSVWAIGQGGPYGEQTLAERHDAPHPAPGLVCP